MMLVQCTISWSQNCYSSMLMFATIASLFALCAQLRNLCLLKIRGSGSETGELNCIECIKFERPLHKKDKTPFAKHTALLIFQLPPTKTNTVPP